MGSFVTMDGLSTIFLLLRLASYVSYFLLPYPGKFPFFVPPRLRSSHLLLSSKYYVFFLLESFLYPALSRNFSVFSCFIRPTIIVPENRKQNRLSLFGVETHARLWPLSFCSTEAKKTCFSHTALHRRRKSSPHRTSVTTKLREHMPH